MNRTTLWCIIVVYHFFTLRWFGSTLGTSILLSQVAQVLSSSSWTSKMLAFFFFYFVIEYIDSLFLRGWDRGGKVVEAECSYYTLYRVTIYYCCLQGRYWISCSVGWTLSAAPRRCLVSCMRWTPCKYKGWMWVFYYCQILVQWVKYFYFLI